MDVEELQKKYEGTGISALSAMVMLEDANVPTIFQLKLDPAQELDWLEEQIYSARKFLQAIRSDKCAHDYALIPPNEIIKSQYRMCIKCHDVKWNIGDFVE